MPRLGMSGAIPLLPPLPPWPGQVQLYCTFVLEANFTSPTNKNRGGNNCAYLAGPVMMPVRFDRALLRDIQTTVRMVICVTNLAYVSPCGGNYKVCRNFVFVMCKCTEAAEHVLCFEHLLMWC